MRFNKLTFVYWNTLSAAAVVMISKDKGKEQNYQPKALADFSAASSKAFFGLASP